MKKNLRLLCLGLAAATFTCGFAQEDKTSLLQNADMEQGLKGWGFEGATLLGKNSKDPSGKPGFYGMNKGVLEAWNANVEQPLNEGYVMQRLGGLPNGTYVFGAYVGASKQSHRKNVAEEGQPAKYEYWSNRDSITGVELFANESVVKVATNNPDWNGMFKESHSSKFNVAVTLSDADKKKGYLDLGIRYANTNANYVVWDNATLYYFGDMSEAAALDAMAEIDVKNVIAIADTLKGVHMNADTLDVLTKVLADAAATKVTAANLEEVSSEIFYTAGLARKSALDYKNLKTNIESAKVVTEGEWLTDIYVKILKDVIADAEKAYDERKMDRDAITALRKELNWSAGDVKYDSLTIAKNALGDFIKAAKLMQDKNGGYTAAQIGSLEKLQAELLDTCGVYEADAELDFEERTVNPNNLLAYIDRVYTAIEEVESNPIDDAAPWSVTLLQSASAIEGYRPLDGSVKVELGYEYTSPEIQFEAPTSLLRLTVSKVASNQIYFCLGSLEFFDAEGNEIPLTAADFYSNADHNTVAGFKDGISYEGLVDDDPNTWFHSDWSGKITEPHYLDVTLPNGYDVVYFKMVSRGNGQRHQFPGEIVVTVPPSQRERNALKELLADAKAKDAYSVAEPGFYVHDFSYLINEIYKVEAALEGEPSEDECKTMAVDLRKAMEQFSADLEINPAVHLPEAGKEYRIISGFPGYYEKQGVEKALTTHAADTTLWWENACADSLQQVFVFEPIVDEDGELFVKREFGENEDGTSWSESYYCYHLKNVASGLYVDSAFVDNKLRLVEEPTDTVMLYSLGRGQWNILVKGSPLHCGDHNSGNVGGPNGAYGGTWGVSSAIVAYGGGLDGASAWFIREVKDMPCEVTVAAGEFKSEVFHFDGANTITLIADKDCAFADLKLYDLYGKTIAIDTVVVSGNKATITQEANLVGCAFAFTNTEGVSSVQFNAFQYTAAVETLQEAYDEAVAVAPIQGTEVGQYADITDYAKAIADAEAILEGGAATDEEIEDVVKRLKESVEALQVNMPEEGKYYFIYSAVTEFEKRNGYRMTLYTADDATIKWGHENYTDNTRYWQFELATEEDIEAAGMEAGTCAYYLKNVANEMYVAEGNGSMTEDREAALPYVIKVLGSGADIALDGLGQTGKRIHANNHGSGAGKGSNIVYWNAGAGSASAWNIVETQYDVTDIDFAEAETEKAVVKGTYDLFGRRVVAPTAPGIYIIEGKKRLVK